MALAALVLEGRGGHRDAEAQHIERSGFGGGRQQVRRGVSMSGLLGGLTDQSTKDPQVSDDVPGVVIVQTSASEPEIGTRRGCRKLEHF